MNNKKTLLIIIFLFLLIIFAISRLIIYLKNPKKEVFTETKLLEERVYFPTINKENTLLYYYSTDNQPGIYQYTLQTKEKKQLTSNLENIQDLIWSPNFDKVLVSVKFDYYVNSIYNGNVEEDGRIVYWLLDLSSKKFTKLAPYTINAGFSEDGNKIISYQYYYPNKIDQFNICNNSYENCQSITNQDYGEGVNIVAWDNKEILAYPLIFDLGNGRVRKLNLETLAIEDISELPDSNFIQKVNNKIIGSTYNDNKNKFYIFDTQNNKLKYLNIEPRLDRIYYKQNINFIIYSLFENKKIIWYKIDIYNYSKTKLSFDGSDDIDKLFISNDDIKYWYVKNDYIYESVKK